MSDQSFLPAMQALADARPMGLKLKLPEAVQFEVEARVVTGAEAVWEILEDFSPQAGWVQGTSTTLTSLEHDSTPWWSAVAGKPVLQGEFVRDVQSLHLRYLGSQDWCLTSYSCRPEQSSGVSSHWMTPACSLLAAYRDQTVHYNRIWEAGSDGGWRSVAGIFRGFGRTKPTE